MALAPGMSLGGYEILSPLGAGGMGEVYRARDTRLKREVALKVLPDGVAHDADRLARFQREAELLAAVNHPNIAAVYGLEEFRSGGSLDPPVTAIVLELVEGDTLADVIARGPLASADALPIARQIADALEAAHDRGVIHRDLKPANIKITPDGRVKVLDFGLAKILEPVLSPSSLTMSPTLSLHATYAGVILGTAAYMSPEQAKGKAVDRRADIWSFGVVLTEMLTARLLYEGETAAETLARVIEREPDLNALPASTPESIRALLLRCLTKDPRARLQAIGEARIVIERALSGTEGAPEAGRHIHGPAKAGAYVRVLPWAVATAFAAALAIVLAMWAPWKDAISAPTRLEAALGADVSLATDDGNAIALSPDGRGLAYVSRTTKSGTGRTLYFRRLDQLEATALVGPDDFRNIFFSADGQRIVLASTGGLKKVAVTGGAAVPIASADNVRGGTWSDTDTIIVADQNGRRLVRVSPGGELTPITTGSDKVGFTSRYYRYPQALPHGKGILVTAQRGPRGFDDADVEVHPVSGGRPKIVMRGAYFARYARSGHLLYVQNGTLFAAPFDLDRLEVTGAGAPILQGLNASAVVGVAQVDISDTGTLVYVPGQNHTTNSVPIHWVDAGGGSTLLQPMPTNWSNILFSPDGSRVALDINNGKQTEVWVYDWSRSSLSPVTFAPSESGRPVWTPDGQRIVFSSTRGDQATLNLYWQRADGTGEPSRLTDSKNNQSAWSWHPSGKLLAYHEYDLQTRDNIYVLPMEGNDTSGWKPGKPIEFLKTPFAERAPMFSPDGKWIAYQSNESGREEIYVRPVSSSGAPEPGKWPISTDGGTTPTWSRAKPELFYATPDQHIMVVSYAVEGTTFHADKPRLWSDARFVPRAGVGGPQRSFDLHPDGKRFALARLSDAQTPIAQDRVVFVFNFFDELRRVAPIKK